jgi:hypothetical protein
MLLGLGDEREDVLLYEWFARHGVPRDRVVFAPRRPRAKYLDLYNRIDIALDPFPYNGGVTSCDDLYMGVPLVALEGDTYHSRQGLMLLTNLGLPELVARTPTSTSALRWISPATCPGCGNCGPGCGSGCGTARSWTARRSPPVWARCTGTWGGVGASGWAERMATRHRELKPPQQRCRGVDGHTAGGYFISRAEIHANASASPWASVSRSWGRNEWTDLYASPSLYVRSTPVEYVVNELLPLSTSRSKTATSTPPPAGFRISCWGTSNG